MKKLFTLSLLLISKFLPVSANEYDNLRIIASLGQADKTRISDSIPTESGASIFSQKTNDTHYLYLLTPTNPYSYHISLDSLYPTAQDSFTTEDVDALNAILDEYESTSFHLNENMNDDQNKYYNANGKEISLFVHGNMNSQKKSKTFTIKNINALHDYFDEINTANLVLKIDSDNQLKEDWLIVRDQILANEHFSRDSRFKNLNEHVTIANLYKCRQNKYNSKTSFFDDDLDSIVELFENVNHDFTQINDIRLDTLAITTKQNRRYKKVRDIRFNAN